MHLRMSLTGLGLILLTSSREALADPPRLWGWADLHAHPAAHLSLGANSNGHGGIFWGKPGMALEMSLGTLPSDMPACHPDKHSGLDGDADVSISRQTESHTTECCRTSFRR